MQGGAPGQFGQPYLQPYGLPDAQGRGWASPGVAAMPYGAVPPAMMQPYPLPYGVPGEGAFDAGDPTVALAQGLDSNLVLSPQQMMPPPMAGAPQYGQQRPGPAYANAYYAPPPAGPPGMRGQQQMMQPHMGPMGQPGPAQHHAMMNGGGAPGPRPDLGGPNGSLGCPRGGPRGGPGGGYGMPQEPPRQQQQQQRRKKVQRGLEDNVKRTVYISYIDQQVTEESLATFFADCGTVMDCRICGDPNSAMRFAFIEFLEELGAQEALNKTGSVLGTSQLRVLPSKTAIVPVNKELMPRSHEELERCSRTVYVANIDKKVEREDVRNFFEQLCGKVGKIRLLGDLAHSTRIAFIEFIQAEAAMAALNCSGALLGALPLRVSPSKTPVRGDREDKEARQQGSRQQMQRPGSNGNGSRPDSDAAVGEQVADGDAAPGEPAPAVQEVAAEAVPVEPPAAGDDGNAAGAATEQDEAAAIAASSGGDEAPAATGDEPAATPLEAPGAVPAGSA